ncbi:MAG: hypothetical protein FJY67_05760 [Calditrichaeota bacterium]|nr:hypothetical protein [Calditrichota bacterium]
MTRKLTLLSIATALVMLVSLAAAPSAWATDLVVRIEVQWGWGLNPQNIIGSAQLLDAQGDPIETVPVLLLQANPGFTQFSGTFLNVPSNAAYVRFCWDDLGLAWGRQGEDQANVNPQAGEVRDINWSGVTVCSVWCSFNNR